jgi:hypothetical protein
MPYFPVSRRLGKTGPRVRRPAPVVLGLVELEAREKTWRGRSEWEIRAEMERAIARRFTRPPVARAS